MIPKIRFARRGTHVRRAAAVLLACAALGGLCSCARAGESYSSGVQAAGSSKSPQASSAVQTTGGFSLPYTNVPAFNPLLPASSFNEVVWPLVYDCVSEPGTDFKPVMRLASSVVSSGNSAVITLKSGLVFSDGSALTGSDVAYTYNYVKQHPASPYSGRLANVQAVKADGLTVTLTLVSPDPLIANLLDIPVIEQGSETGNAVGSGRYTYAKNGVDAVLSQNPKWYGGAKRPFASIPLVNIPDPATMMSSLSIGLINYVYSDSGGGAASTPVNATTADVNLNQLVFLGVNTRKAPLSNAHFRRALSLALDRSGLVSQTYSGRARASCLPFSPVFSLLPAPSAQSLGSNYAASAAELSKAGGAGSMALTLLVNQENTVRTAAAKYAAGCFQKAGVNVTVKAVPLAEYQADVASDSYDLFIGETVLDADMDVTPLLGGALSPGAPANGAALAAFKQYRAGNGTLTAAAAAFSDEMPILPLCYRMGTTSYTRGLSGVEATNGDIFFQFETWSRS